MPNITLGKVKLMHRGTYSASTVYSKGDIVDYDNRTYVFTNETPKNHAPIFLNTINGTVSSLGIQTNKIRMDFSGFNPQTQKWGLVTSHQRYSGADGTMPGVYAESGEEFAPPTGLMVYSEYFDPYVGITSVNVVDSNTADLYLNQVGINTSTISNAPFTLGPRRMCGMYEFSVNWLDWDIMSEGYNPVGEWSDDSVYLPGDIVQKGDSSYICGVGNSDVDPAEDFPGCWRIFSRGDTPLPHQYVKGFVNKQPWKWKGHPWIDLPKWGTNNQWNGNIPWNTSLGIGSTSPHAWRWNSGWNDGHMAYRKANQFLVAGGASIIAEGGTANEYYTQGDNTNHMSVRSADVSNAMNAKIGVQPDIGNLPRTRTDHNPPVIQAFHGWTACRANLHSNGTLTMSGTYGQGYLGYSNDHGTAQGVNLHKAVFKGRSIVKVVCGAHQARDGDTHIIALDEYGEIHTWGRNDTGQCGISSERNRGFGDSSPDILYFSAGGMSVNNRTYLIHSMNKDLFFGGKKIVDIWIGHRWSMVMDEDGELWSWGYNTRGNLGYPTNSGFGDSDRSYSPQKINVNWASYGGIQKCVISHSEANVDSLYVLDGNGSIWSQGYNGYGQLGSQNTTTGTNSSSLTRRTGLTGNGSIRNFWADNNESYGHLWWRINDGSTYGCGYDGHHNVTGDSSAPGTASGNNPTYMPGSSSNQLLKNCVAMCCSGRSGGITQYFLTDKGHVYSTGWNGYGEGGVGHSTTVTNNQIRYQQNGQRAYALGRQLHAPFYSAGGSNAADNTSTSSTVSKGPSNAVFDSGGATCIDIWATGDYDGNSGHTPWSMTLFDNGELTGRGRNYDWGAAYYMGNIWGSIHHHGAG
jgi:YD repeat-containing protein